MHLFRMEENRITRNKIQKIIDSGINVVVNRKGIDLVAQDLLTKFGIMSIKRVKENDLHWLEKNYRWKYDKGFRCEEHSK